MNISYLVHGVSTQTRPSIGVVNGATLSVDVREIEVELSDPINQHGSVQLHFRTPDEKAYALATFIPGQTVTIALPDAPPPAATPIEPQDTQAAA